MLKANAKTTPTTKGNVVTGIGHDTERGQDTKLGSIRGGAVKVVRDAAGQMKHKDGKFPPNGNQEKPKNRISFDVKPTGNAAAVPVGPQDSKDQLAENQKKKRTAAQTLYPKMRSVMQTEAA